MTQLQAVQDQTTNIVEHVLIQGDLSRLTPEDRIQYYNGMCAHLGLNPLTRPFEYIKFNGGKVTLYATKCATDQLRKVHGVNIDSVNVVSENGFYVATAIATDKDGRTDTDVGVVQIPSGSADAKANAYKKAVTQAKRRVTLGIGGLGLLDQTEAEQTDSYMVDSPSDPRLHDYLMQDVQKLALDRYGNDDEAVTKLNDIAAAIGRRRGMPDLTIVSMTVDDLQFIKDGLVKPVEPEPVPTGQPALTLADEVQFDQPSGKVSSEEPVGYTVPVDVDKLLEDLPRMDDESIRALITRLRTAYENHLASDSQVIVLDDTEEMDLVFVEMEDGEESADGEEHIYIYESTTHDLTLGVSVYVPRDQVRFDTKINHVQVMERGNQNG